MTLEPTVAREEFERSHVALHDLYEVAGRTDLDFPERIRRLLEIGCKRLQLPIGFFTEIGGGEQRIVGAVGDHPELQEGGTAPLGESYCRKTITEDDLVGYENAPAEGWKGDPAYERFRLNCYLGGKVEVDGELYGTLCFADRLARERSFTEGEKTFVRLLVQWISGELERQRLLEKMTELARTDELTQVANRRVLIERIENEVDRSERYGGELSLLILDIDDFKDVNDRFGHLLGDEVLRTLASLLEETSREPDVVGRYGGEEFGVVLPQTGLDEGVALAERVIERVRDEQFERNGETLSITCSVGVAELSESESNGEELLRRADDALYRAKKRGRDRVEAAGEDGSREKAE